MRSRHSALSVFVCLVLAVIMSITPALSMATREDNVNYTKWSPSIKEFKQYNVNIIATEIGDSLLADGETDFELYWNPMDQLGYDKKVWTKYASSSSDSAAVFKDVVWNVTGYYHYRVNRTPADYMIPTGDVRFDIEQQTLAGAPTILQWAFKILDGATWLISWIPGVRAVMTAAKFLLSSGVPVYKDVVNVNGFPRIFSGLVRKNFSWTSPGDAIYYFKTGLQPKVTSNLVVETYDVYKSVQICRLTSTACYDLELRDGAYRMREGDTLPVGDYELVTTTQSGARKSYRFSLRGLQAPRDMYGKTTAPSFTGTEKDAFEETEYYQKYYKGQSAGKSLPLGRSKVGSLVQDTYDDNLWTLVSSNDSQLEVVYPTALGRVTEDGTVTSMETQNHVLKLHDLHQLQLVKKWNVEIPDNGDKIYAQLYKVTADGEKVYYTGSAPGFDATVSCEYPKADENGTVFLLDREYRDNFNDDDDMWLFGFNMPSEDAEFLDDAESLGLTELNDDLVEISDSTFSSFSVTDDCWNVYLVNYETPVTIGLLKNDADYPERYLSGAEFKLRDVTNSGKVVESPVVSSCKTEDGHSYYLLMLQKNHSYELLETQAPDGYEADETGWRIVLGGEDGKEVTFTHGDSEVIKPQAGESEEGTINFYTLSDEMKDPSTVTVTKEWLDGTGNPIDPPEGVNSVSFAYHAPYNETDAPALITLTRDENWTKTEQIPSVEHGTYTFWEAAGQLPEGWNKPEKTEYAVVGNDADNPEAEQEFTGNGELISRNGQRDYLVTVKNSCSTVRFFKRDGKVLAPKNSYCFYYPDGRTLDGNNDEGYVLDLTRVSNGDVIQEYRIDDQSTGGDHFVCEWKLSIDRDGKLTDVTYASDAEEGKTEPDWEYSAETGRHYLDNPVDTFEFTLEKVWNIPDEVLEKTGLPDSVTFSIYPYQDTEGNPTGGLNSGSGDEEDTGTAADMSIEVTLLAEDQVEGSDPPVWQKKVKLPEGYRYLLMEDPTSMTSGDDIHDLASKIKPSYNTVYEDKVDHDDPEFHVYCAVFSSECEDLAALKTVRVTNTYAKDFKVYVLFRDNDNAQKMRPAKTLVQLQKKEYAVNDGGAEVSEDGSESGITEGWVNVLDEDGKPVTMEIREWSESLTDDEGNPIQEEDEEWARNIGNCTFKDLDAGADYRARLCLYDEKGEEFKPLDEDGSAYTVKPEGQEAYIFCQKGTDYYSTEYNDGSLDYNIQSIVLSMNTLTAEIRWMDADNRDNIRPGTDKVTLELLKQTTSSEGGSEETSWTNVTANGEQVKVTVSAQAKEWTEEDGVGSAKVTFHLDDVPQGTYRVRVEGTDEKDRVTFDEAVYKEAYTDSEKEPVVTLTAQKEYKVEKTWDVDLEKNDIPDKLNVILQKKPEDSEASKDSSDSEEKKDWGNPVSEMVLTKDADWKGTFPSVDRYSYKEEKKDDKTVITWDKDEATYRVREAKDAKLKGKLSDLIGSMEESAVSGLGLPDFVTDYLKDKLPDSKETEDKIYGWACSQTEDTAVGKLVKSALKDSIPEDGETITLSVPERTSVAAGKTIEAHDTTYQVSYSEDGNTTKITNLAIEEVTIWKRWVNIDEKDRPDHVYLILTSKFDSDFSKAASDMGIPLVNDYTPVFRPISGDTVKIPIVGWSVPIAIGKAVPKEDSSAESKALSTEGDLLADDSEEKSDDKPEWTVHFRVKKYGESGIPQSFRGYELQCYLVSEAAKAVLGPFIGSFAKIFEYVGFNFFDKYLSVSFPAVRMPSLIAQFGDVFGYSNLAGLHSLVVNTWAKIGDNPSIGGTKTWDDGDNKDKIRPDKVTIHVFEKKDDGSKGDELGTAEASQSTYWTWTFSSDKIDKSKEYLIEEDVVEGYETTVDGYNITNKHEPKKESPKANVVVKKVWDPKAPENFSGLKVYLQRNGQTADTATLTEAENWTHTFQNLDLNDENGSRITYTVTEDSIPNYKLEKTATDTAEKDNVTTYTVTLTNKCTDTGKGNFTVIKQWSGDKSSDRPESVHVTVKGGENTYEADLKASTGWKHTFKDIPAVDKDGKTIDYTVSELKVDGYTTETGEVSVTKENNGTTYECTITNTKEKEEEKTSYTVTKVWEDEDDKAKKRPSDLRIYLYANGKKKAAEILTESDNWTFTFENLPKKDDDGNEIRYSATEETVEGYEASTESGTDSCTITNTYKGEEEGSGKAKVVVLKKWEGGDPENLEGLTVQLLRNGTVLDEARLTAPYWSHMFSDLDLKDENGNLYEYTVTEETPAGYKQKSIESTKKDGEGENDPTVYTFTITNEPDEDEYLTMIFHKVWKNAPEGELPAAHIRVTGGGNTTETDLNSEGNWTRILEYIRSRDSRGNKISYTVTEDAIEGYTTSIDHTTTVDGKHTTYEYTITNTRSDSTASYEVIKVWKDDNVLNRPESLTVYLKADGTVTDSYDMTEDDGWKHTFADLPVYDADHNKIKYEVSEEEAPGYQSDGGKVEGPDASNKYTCTFTNRLETTEYTVVIRKVWDDEESEKRPSSVTVHLSNGETERTLAVREENGWIAKVNGLKKTDADGKAYTWTLREDVPDGYAVKIAKDAFSEDSKCTFTVTNTKKTKKETIHVIKKWADSDSENRPSSVTVQLLRNGVKQGEDIVLTSPDWSRDIEDCRLYDDQGKAYRYTLAEPDVPERYEASYAIDQKDSELTLTVTNTETVPADNEAELKVTKVWNEAGGEKIEHDSIAILVSADGNPYDLKSLGPDENGNWTDTWAVPLRNDEGKKITYTVAEFVPEGYTGQVSKVTQTGKKPVTYSCTVTNLRKVKLKVTYKLLSNPKYGIPENLQPPVDSNVYGYGDTVQVKPRQRTAWTTSDGTGAGIKGVWEFTGWYFEDAGATTRDLAARATLGKNFTITGDTTLVGYWNFIPQGYGYEFTFHKVWKNADGDHGTPRFILYNSDGSVRRDETQQPKKTGTDTYTYWLAEYDDYYVQELPMKGYWTDYSNSGKHKGVTDRAYNGGDVVNHGGGHGVPQTGDKTPLALLAGACILSGAVLLAMRRRKRGQ